MPSCSALNPFPHQLREGIPNSNGSITRTTVDLVSYQWFDECEQLQVKSAAASAANECRGVDFLGESLTTSLAIAPEFVAFMFPNRLKSETLTMSRIAVPARYANEILTK